MGLSSKATPSSGSRLTNHWAILCGNLRGQIVRTTYREVRTELIGSVTQIRLYPNSELIQCCSYLLQAMNIVVEPPKKPMGLLARRMYSAGQWGIRRTTM